MVGYHKDNTYLQQFNVLHALTWYAVKCACGLIGNRSILRNGCSNVPWRLCASSHLGEPPQCFSIVLDFIQTIRRTPGKHDQLGIANKTRRQPITATLGKLYVVALFISPLSSRTCISPTSPSFCTLHYS